MFFFRHHFLNLLIFNLKHNFKLQLFPYYNIYLFLLSFVLFFFLLLFWLSGINLYIFNYVFLRLNFFIIFNVHLYLLFPKLFYHSFIPVSIFLFSFLYFCMCQVIVGNRPFGWFSKHIIIHIFKKFFYFFLFDITY